MNSMQLLKSVVSNLIKLSRPPGGFLLVEALRALKTDEFETSGELLEIPFGRRMPLGLAGESGGEGERGGRFDFGARVK